MNMASMGILLFTTVTYVSVGFTHTAFANLECKAETVGQYGQQSLLECVVKTTRDDAEIRVVTWKKEGADDPLLVFHRGEMLPKGGTFAEPSWNARNMNVSLLISNTAVEDEGDYKCMVLTDSGEGSGKTSLKVTAKYSKPTVRSDPEETPTTEVTLTCDSHGGYPKGQLRWFTDQDTEWLESPEMEATQMKSGLFHLSRKLTFLKGSPFTKFTCKVFNASGGKEEETTFEVPDRPRAGGQGQEQGKDPTSKIVAPVVVIGSLIVGLLLVGIFMYRRRSQRERREVPAYDLDVEEGDHQKVDVTRQDSPA